MKTTAKQPNNGPDRAALTGDIGAYPPPAARRLTLSIQNAAREQGLPSRSQLRRWLRACEPGAAQVTIRFVGIDEGRALNAAYRGKDYATNVLSFPYSPMPELAGDLVICAPVVLREAAQQGKAGEAHFAHLVVHGMLHLQGYDHENDAEAQAMENKEREILARLGYADPYRGKG